MKPKITVTEEVHTQTQALQVKRAELILARNATADRLSAIERIVEESARLDSLAKEQLEESVTSYLEEWEKNKELYPEVRLGMLESIVQLLKPKA